MISRRRGFLRHTVALLSACCYFIASADAATLTFTVTTSEPVTVTGVPRIAIDVGGQTRYATYGSGSASSSLTFGYAVQARDFDANGITLVSPLDLNGGSLVDGSGNPATNLTFTLPETSGIRIQTYRTSFNSGTITAANASAVGFLITKAPQGGTYSYTITSSGGAGSVTGSGTISSGSQSVSGVDVSSLPAGTLTLSVSVTTADGGTGAPTQATAALDNLPPTGYTAAFLASAVNIANSTSTGFRILDGEIGDSYSYTISSSGGSTTVSGTGTIGASPQQVTGLDLSGIADGTLTLSVTLSDTLGNTGSAVTATVAKDTLAPTLVSVTGPAAGTYDDL